VKKKRKKRPKQSIWIEGTRLNEDTGLLEPVKYKVKI